MAENPILLREQRFYQIKALLARLRLDAAARLVVLVDKDGQQIAVHGEQGDVDTTSLASLAADGRGRHSNASALTPHRPAI